MARTMWFSATVPVIGAFFSVLVPMPILHTVLCKDLFSHGRLRPRPAGLAALLTVILAASGARLTALSVHRIAGRHHQANNKLPGLMAVVVLLAYTALCSMLGANWAPHVGQDLARSHDLLKPQCMVTILLSAFLEQVHARCVAPEWAVLALLQIYTLAIVWLRIQLSPFIPTPYMVCALELVGVALPALLHRYAPGLAAACRGHTLGCASCHATDRTVSKDVRCVWHPEPTNAAAGASCARAVAVVQRGMFGISYASPLPTMHNVALKIDGPQLRDLTRGSLHRLERACKQAVSSLGHTLTIVGQSVRAGCILFTSSWLLPGPSPPQGPHAPGPDAQQLPRKPLSTRQLAEALIPGLFPVLGLDPPSGPSSTWVASQGDGAELPPAPPDVVFQLESTRVLATWQPGVQRWRFDEQVVPPPVVPFTAPGSQLRLGLVRSPPGATPAWRAVADAGALSGGPRAPGASPPVRVSLQVQVLGCTGDLRLAGSHPFKHGADVSGPPGDADVAARGADHGSKASSAPASQIQSQAMTGAGAGQCLKLWARASCGYVPAALVWSHVDAKHACAEADIEVELPSHLPSCTPILPLTLELCYGDAQLLSTTCTLITLVAPDAASRGQAVPYGTGTWAGVPLHTAVAAVAELDAYVDAAWANSAAAACQLSSATANVPVLLRDVGHWLGGVRHASLLAGECVRCGSWGPGLGTVGYHDSCLEDPHLVAQLSAALRGFAARVPLPALHALMAARAPNALIATWEATTPGTAPATTTTSTAPFTATAAAAALPRDAGAGPAPTARPHTSSTVAVRGKASVLRLLRVLCSARAPAWMPLLRAGAWGFACSRCEDTYQQYTAWSMRHGRACSALIMAAMAVVAIDNSLSSLALFKYLHGFTLGWVLLQVGLGVALWAGWDTAHGRRGRAVRHVCGAVYALRVVPEALCNIGVLPVPQVYSHACLGVWLLILTLRALAERVLLASSVPTRWITAVCCVEIPLFMYAPGRVRLRWLRGLCAVVSLLVLPLGLEMWLRGAWAGRMGGGPPPRARHVGGVYRLNGCEVEIAHGPFAQLLPAGAERNSTEGAGPSAHTIKDKQA